MAPSRGKSVPTIICCALDWLESHAKVHLSAGGVEIKSFVMSLARPCAEGAAVKDHEQAPPLPVDTVCAIEGLCSTAHSLPLRVFSGVICLCVHGVKRWADVQHVRKVVNTIDGVMLTTYRSKISWSCVLPAPECACVGRHGVW